MKKQDLIVAIGIFSIVVLLIIPIPTWMLDLLLVFNIALSLLILLLSLFTKSALDFSAFPTILLITTLFRLSLSLKATLLILGNNGQAGSVIATFGNFVVGGDLVVGMIIFILIVLVQFLVITKGAERVAEVSARFTLDSMPGKQMAIDADLSAGLIDENTAKQRREDIQREASFYGAMDGASKFVKGDAIMGIITTIVNIVGGLIIGSTVGGMPFDQVAQVYILATVGDGLVSQIPALMISTATGIIVTRSASTDTLGTELFDQLFSNPMVMFILAGMVAMLGFIPGMPTIPMLIFSILMAVTAYSHIQKEKQLEVEEVEDTAEVAAAEKRKPESVTSLLQVDLIEMEFGYGIISLVDASQGGDLLDRVVMIRRQCALDLGIIVPMVRLRDNVQLPTNAYSIKIKGLEVASGEVMLDHYLALLSSEVDEPIAGIETTEPAFGLPALWIAESERERAELKGYTTIDAPSVIATHLMETIKRHAAELLSRQQVQILIDNLKRQQPALVEEVVPKMFSIGEIQKILANLLSEDISIRDLGSILEIVADHGTLVRDTDLLTEYVRQGMSRAITQRFATDGVIRVVTLDPQLEQQIAENVRQSEQGSYVVLEPNVLQSIALNLRDVLEQLVDLGTVPIVLTSPVVRRHFKDISRQVDPNVVVLSYNELEQDVQIYSEGVVTL